MNRVNIRRLANANFRPKNNPLAQAAGAYGRNRKYVSPPPKSGRFGDIPLQISGPEPFTL
jgi:hypothetical protein